MSSDGVMQNDLIWTGQLVAGCAYFARVLPDFAQTSTPGHLSEHMVWNLKKGESLPTNYVFKLSK